MIEVKINITQDGKKPRVEQFGKIEDARDFLVSLVSKDSEIAQEPAVEPEASQEETPVEPENEEEGENLDAEDGDSDEEE